MTTRRLLVSIALVTPVVIGLPLTAQDSKRAAASPPLTAMQALPLTCAEAWIASEKNYDRMLAVVVTLAKVSLVNRDLTFPNDREAGINAGKGIGADCKADPDALLFAVVDKHVRRIAGTKRR